MVGWVRWREKWRLWPKAAPVGVLGFPLLGVDLPRGNPESRGRQAAKLLRRRGAARALLPPELAGAFPGVSPLPLCRALGAELALALLEEIPLRERRVTLRGERADRLALTLADALCPRVGALYLDFDRGGEALATYLHSRYGAPPRPGQAPDGGLWVELAPGGEERPALRLWGEPDLLGLELSIGETLPPDLPTLPFLTLLWESGRVKKEDIMIGKP